MTNTTNKITFILQMSNGAVINQDTVIKGKNGVKVIYTELELCNLIKAAWCKDNNVKSFTQWADELNEDENFTGTYSKDDALDNLNNTFVLNIDGKYIDLIQFFNTYKPFKS